MTRKPDESSVFRPLAPYPMTQIRTNHHSSPDTVSNDTKVLSSSRLLTFQRDHRRTVIGASRAPLEARWDAHGLPRDERLEPVAFHARRTLARVRTDSILALGVSVALRSTARTLSFGGVWI